MINSNYKQIIDSFSNTDKDMMKKTFYLLDNWVTEKYANLDLLKNYLLWVRKKFKLSYHDTKLYRGISDTKIIEQIQKKLVHKENITAKFTSSLPIQSWTSDKNVAKDFTTQIDFCIIGSKIPGNLILINYVDLIDLFWTFEMTKDITHQLFYDFLKDEKEYIIQSENQIPIKIYEYIYT